MEKIKVSNELENATKPELMRDMTSEEISQLRSDAGKLAWISTATSPLLSFHSSIALQRNKFRKIPPLSLLQNIRKTIAETQKEKTSSLRNVQMDEESIHIRVYSDGAFQNLPTKHSQIGFIIALADRFDTFNIVHWQSARANRRPHSTEQSELLALDAALRCIENLG